MTLQLKNAAGLALIFLIAVSSLQQVTGRWSTPPAKLSCAIGHVGLASLLPRQVTGWSAGTTASKVHGAAALLATNALLLPQETDAIWRAGTAASKVHGAAALLATNALLLPQGSDALLSTGTTASKVQSAVALLATNALFNFQETEAQFGGTCGYGSPAGTCGANDCCGSDNNCGGLQNACTIDYYCPLGIIDVGCYSCCGDNACTDVKGLRVLQNSCIANYACNDVVDTTIGNGSCVGLSACKNAVGSSVGDGSCLSTQDQEDPTQGTGSTCTYLDGSKISSGSCVGDYSCYYVDASAIGSGSCVGDSSCQNVAFATIGSGSCNDNFSCVGCFEGNVPDNSCNNLTKSWEGELTADNNYSGYNNYCQFCRNCLDKNTGQSCYVSSLSATSSTQRLSSTRGLKVRDPSGQKKGDAECSALKDTILTFFMSVQELPSISQKLVGYQTKAQVVGNKSNKKPGDHCTIKWSFVSEHLGNKQELEAMCNALEAMFLLKKEEFLIDNRSFANVVLTCNPKDLNANKGDTKKKGEKTKKKKKGASKALAVSPLHV